MNRVPTDFLIVVGTPGPLQVDLESLGQRMANPAVRADLKRVGLDDPYHLVNTLLTGDAGLERYLGVGPLHTDDRPVLSYSTYGASYRSTIATNLLQLMACRECPAKYVTHGDPRRLLYHYAASNEVLLGHIAALRGQLPEALGHYAEGSKLLPEDGALRERVALLYLSMQPPGQVEECVPPPVDEPSPLLSGGR
jgi:hypothetical protein